MSNQGQQWDRWFKVASVVTTSLVIPGVTWAFQVTQDMHDMRTQIKMLSQQMEVDRKGTAIVLEEIKLLRASVDLMRTDILQRLTRVETRMETK
jgi:hypothetical protein